MQFDFSFDKRVAQRYEAQRAHPAAVSRQIGRTVVDVCGADAAVLEIGIGTGRIARPVADAGARVTGFDISADMLTATDAYPNVTLLQADMHALPFQHNAFDATLAVHVLHLAQVWQDVLGSAARVLKPGGAFIQGDDWIDPESVVGRLRDELRQRAMALSPNARPPAAGISKQQMLADLGGTETEERIAAEWVTWVSPQDRLDAIEQRMDAESWFLPDDVFDVLFDQLQTFSAETWPDLTQKQPVTRRFVLKITRGAW